MVRAVLVIAAAVVVSACGGAGSGDDLTGAELFVEVGCHACHEDSDTEVAPTLNGVWGTETTLADGRTVVVDEGYVRRALLEPSADIVAGYEPRMPIFALTDSELTKLVEYVESLG